MKRSQIVPALFCFSLLAFPSCSSPETPVSNQAQELDVEKSMSSIEGVGATIGDLVWLDENNNGMYDAGEPGIAGVTVNLLCAGEDGEFGTSDDYSDSQVTDANGNYLFTNVPGGHACRIWVDLTTLPPGVVPGICRTRHSCQPKAGKVYLTIDFCFVMEAEGCTPGYWKNHEESWASTGYSTGQSVESVFADALAYPALGAASLLEALDFAGGSGPEGGAGILLRAAVAALLNASHGNVNYPLSEADVISMVNAALASGDRDTMIALATTLDNDNNLGCPLN